MSLQNLLDMIQSKEAVTRAAGITYEARKTRFPSLHAGNKIRCVWGLGMLAYPSDKLAFEEGRVYDVINVGSKAIQAKMEQDGEQFNLDAINMLALVRAAEEDDPEAAGYAALVRDPKTGVENLITYPAYPNALFLRVSDNAVDEPQRNDLEPGQLFEFQQLNTLITRDWLTVGKNYEVLTVEDACYCEDPSCAAKGRRTVTFLDDQGDVLRCMLPFSHLGIAKLISA